MGENSLEKRENEDELEFLDLEPEIREFVRVESSRQQEPAGKGPGRSSRSNRTGRRPRTRSRRGTSYLWTVLLLGVVVAVALCGLLCLRQPAVVVLLVIVLEVILAVCLRSAPLWLHGLVLILNVVLGVIFGKPILMLLAELVYLAELVSAYFQGKGRRRR